jgi:hypothetical protein
MNNTNSIATPSIDFYVCTDMKGKIKQVIAVKDNEELRLIKGQYAEMLIKKYKAERGIKDKELAKCH